MDTETGEQLVSTALRNRVLTLALNRPDVHNALNPQLVAELTLIFRQASQRDDVRVVVLTGAGHSFCAGADLVSMRAAADYDFEQNVADGAAIFDLMFAIDRCAKPVVGRINGAAIGGGVGLAATCDIVVADERAKFAFSEVRLGLVPAVIAPFVLNKIGPAHARQLFLTGERFDAYQARRIGLVHHVADREGLDVAVADYVEMLQKGAPLAQAATKELIRAAGRPFDVENLRQEMAEFIAGRRASDEGREGMMAFLQKREPAWQL